MNIQSTFFDKDPIDFCSILEHLLLLFLKRTKHSLLFFYCKKKKGNLVEDDVTTYERTN